MTTSTARARTGTTRRRDENPKTAPSNAEALGRRLEVYCFWNTIVPLVMGNVVCGVRVNVLPETQYAYDVA